MSKKITRPPKFNLERTITETDFGSDKYRVYVSNHNYTYEFDEFKDLGNFCAACCRAFGRYVSPRSQATADTCRTRIIHLLRFICYDTSSVVLNYFDKIRHDHTVLDRTDWETLLEFFRQHLFAKMGAKSPYANRIIQTTNAFLDHLSKCNMLPPLTPMQVTPNWRKRSQNRATLLEACNFEVPETGGPIKLTEQGIYKAEVYLLNTLRSCAEKELLYWYNHWKSAQDSIAHHNKSHRAEIKALKSKFTNNELAKKIQTKINFDASDNPFVLLLCLIQEQIINGGEPSDQQWRHLNNLLRFRFKDKIPRNNSSLTTIDCFNAFFFAHPSAQIAAMTIIMVDTGMNVSSVTNLTGQALKDGLTKGYKSIATWKDRANGQLIVEELPVKDKNKISAIRAFEMIAEMNQLGCQVNSNKTVVEEAFFIAPPRTYAAKRFKKHNYLAIWSRFKENYKVLRDKPILPSQIRPSVILVTSIKGGLAAARVKAKHSSLSSVTEKHYTNRLANRVIDEKKIRDFQSAFQAVAIRDIDQASAKLGIENSRFNEDLKRAESTGLGVLCQNPSGGFQPKTGNTSLSEEKCSTPEQCLGCTKMVVVADEQIIADMMLFNARLKSKQDSMLHQRSERWMQIWLPWLIFTDVVLDRLRKGPYAKKYILATQVVSGSNRAFPPIW